MNLDSVAFYVIGLLCMIILGEIRSVLSTISQRLKWINQDIQKLGSKEEK